MIFSPEFVLDERCMEWKMGGKVCFGEKLHKSMALSLEQSPHKYWEMGMHVGGVNQEGDNLGRGSLAEEVTVLRSSWEEYELGGWAEAGTSALKKKQDQREEFKAQ